MTQNQEPIVSQVNTPTKLAKSVRRILPRVILGIAVLVILIVGVVSLVNYRQNHDSLLGVCSNSLIKKASNSFAESQVSQLAVLESQIQTLPRYQQDPNCTYILTVYYINTFNAKGAQNSINQFNKFYSNNLSPVLTRYLTAAKLRDKVSFTQKVISEDSNNSSLSSLPPSSKSGSNK